MTSDPSDLSALIEGMTKAEKACLEHTLGYNQSPKQDRNYFAASPGSEDDEALRELALFGIVHCYARPEDNAHMPYNIYRATIWGKKVAHLLKEQSDER